MTAATTPLQQQTIGDTVTGWSQALAFGQFDPALGTVTDIAFGLTGDIRGNVALDNLDRAPAAFTVGIDGALQLTGPVDATLLASVAPVATASTTLAAGAGTLLAGISGSAGTTADFQPSTQPGGLPLAPFIGTGSVPLAVAAQARVQVSGPGNMLVASQAAAGASVTLQYGYAAANSGDSTGSVGVIDTWGNPVLAPVVLSGSVTTAAQTFRFADRTTAWNDSLAVNPFDPALGTLESVNITLSGNILAHIGAENLDAAAGAFNATDTATLTVDLPGGTPTLTATAAVSDSMALAAFDGSPDFAGGSGYSHNQVAFSNAVSNSHTLSSPADLAPFTGGGIVVLPIAGTSAASIQGPGNLLAGLFTDAGATVSVSFTYLPTTSDGVGTVAASPSGYTLFDTTTGQPGAATAQPHAGGQTQQLIDHSNDDLAVTVSSDNWLIGTGGGNDAITLHGGDNVVFAGGGSNFLTGGGGDDMFGVSAGGGAVWNTVVNFHAGDWLMVWGVSPQGAVAWQNGQGAAGDTGLTLRVTAADGSAAAVTLAHYYSTADLGNGRLTTGFGGDAANGGSFFYIHANT